MNDIHEMTKMKSYVVLLPLTFLVACVTTPSKVATFETERLVIRDITGDLSPKGFEKFVDKVDSTFTKILQFWSTDPGVIQFELSGFSAAVSILISWRTN